MSQSLLKSILQNQISITLLNSLFIMRNFLKSQATFDTYEHKQTNLHIHNCPTCRCKSPQNISKLSNCLSQPILQFHNTTQNLYLTRDYNDNIKNERLTFAYNNRFENKIHFKYPNELALPKSSSPMNIKFSYVSPPTKYRRYNSNDAKFNTKKFKDKHFPHIYRDESNDEPVKKIIKNINSKNPFLEIFTNEQTPQKHKILKMNKVKQKPEVSLSDQSSQAKQQKYQQNILQNSSNYKNDSELREERKTPINALRMEFDQKLNSKHLQSSQSYFSKEEGIIPKSIELVKSQHLKQYSYDNAPKIFENSPQILQKNKLESILNGQKIVLSNKFKTVNSIDIYEQKKYGDNSSEKIFPNKEKDCDISVKIGRQQHFLIQQQRHQANRDQQLANSLSEQLELNYDYYIPMNDSDRSLSVNVTL